MKKMSVMFVSLFLLSACGWVNRGTAQLTGSSESCVDGVKYLQFASGVTVKYEVSSAGVVEIARCK